MKRILWLTGFTCMLYLMSTAQVKKLVRQAENNIDRGNLREAIDRYEKALAADPDNRSANLELGLVYSELLDNYEKAEPYLEKAYRSGSNDSLYDVIFALAKCYHYRGDFQKALAFFDRLEGVQDLESELDFQKELSKRKKDCEYARDHAHNPPDENIYLVNCGKKINSDMPEYVPVLTSENELLFTSKRKDDRNEELNYLDGKYFESMYLAKVTPTGFSEARRYALPDKLMNSKFYKHHQAVVSLSQDGKKLFTFRDSKLFEISTDDRQQAEPTEIKINQFNHYQNHAFLTADGRTLYFTSDVPGGYGGTDIYRSELTPGGEWGSPKNLGEPVNTAFDEDAPYLAPDGTLYFASKGHEGFGNYDIYKTYFVEGKWTQPENLGAPINSTGHDIFMVFDSSSAVGYFSSGRKGGFGDMDIYRIVYLDRIGRSCNSEGLANLLKTDPDTSDYRNTLSLSLPHNYRMLLSEWVVDGSLKNVNSPELDYDYADDKSHQVKLKALLGCDTCLMPLVACLESENQIRKIPPVPVLAAHEQPSANEGPVSEGTAAKNETASAKKTAGKTLSKHQRNDGNAKYDHPLNNSAHGSSELLLTLHFEFNSSELSAGEKEKVSSLLGKIRSGNLHLIIEGFADARGPAVVNRQISLKRAAEVKQLLLTEGLNASQLRKTIGRGAAFFVNECGPGIECDESRHAENRRVEIRLSE